MKKTLLKLISLMLVILCISGNIVSASESTEVSYATNNSDFAIKSAEIIKKYDDENTVGKLRISGRVENGNLDFYSLGATECVVGKDGRFLLQFSSQESLDLCLGYLANNPAVIYAEQDKTVYSEAIQTQSEGCLSWGVIALGADIYASYLAENQPDESVTVAIIDSGVAKIDFVSSKLVEGYDFIAVEAGGTTDTSVDSHGTFLATIVTDCTKNANVNIMPVRVLDSKTGSLTNAVNGIYYAVDNGADVINISLGGEILNCISLDNAIAYADEKGVSVVVCSGNVKKNTKNYCPAHNESAITVSSVNEDLAFSSSFSNYGDAVDMCAPGVSIMGYNAQGEEVAMSGTSMSAAYISAGAAMLRLQHPEYTPYQVQESLKGVCTDLGTEGFDIYYGYGIPDFEKFTKDDTVYADGISFDKSEKTLLINESLQLDVIFTPENATNKSVIWESSDPSTVSVDENGVIFAHKYGYAVITATAVDGNHSASITIFVAEPEIISVTLNTPPIKTSYTYKGGETLNLNGIELEVAYSDGSKTIVTDISQMNASGFSDASEGTQTVTVEYEGYTVKFNVTVGLVWWQWIIRILLLGFIWY